jgi:hypothetical protein
LRLGERNTARRIQTPYTKNLKTGKRGGTQKVKRFQKVHIKIIMRKKKKCLCNQLFGVGDFSQSLQTLNPV